MNLQVPLRYMGSLFDHGKHFTYNVSASVTSASCISDTLKSLKMQSNSWHASHRTQRSINLNMCTCICRNIWPVCVISVAVIMAVV